MFGAARQRWWVSCRALMVPAILFWLSPIQARAQTNTTDVRKSVPLREESVHLKPSLATEPTRAPSEVSPWDLVTKSPPASLVGLKVTGDAQQATLAITVEGVGRLRAFVLAAPPRLVIEGDGLSFGPALAQTILAGASLVVDFRFGALDTTTGRLVLDLARSAQMTAFTRTSEDGVTLSLTAAAAGAGLGDPLVLDLAAMPEPAARPDRGAKRRLVLIDAGHGGKDPGAVTDSGIFEKDVVLAVALRLQAALSVSGRYDVRMTRSGDSSVTLDRRVAISRSLQPDLFISLHADTFSGQPQAAAVRGGSIYVLAERASNRSAAVLADKENAADLRLGPDAAPSTGDAAVDGILFDLTSRETQTFAADFQGGLVKSLKGVIQLAREPARGAAFKVLKQAGTPAVLIELGYMSHAQDIAALQAPEWQGQVAAAITRAIDAYFVRPRSLLSAR